MRRFMFVLAGALTALAAAPARGQYTTIGIGSGFTTVNGVNDAGAMVGTQGNLGNQPEIGFVRTGPEILPVSVFLTQTGASNVTANGINKLGQIVGNYTDEFGSHGYMQSNITTYTTIDFPGAEGTVATAINDSGEIVGYYLEDSKYNGFVDIGGSLSALNPPGATYTQIYGINNAGQISGTYGGGDCPQRDYCGFVYQGGKFTRIMAPGAFDTDVYGVSNSGIVVGQYFTETGVSHGFMESGGVFTNVDVPGSMGTTVVIDANSSGVLVGNYTITVPGTFGGTITLGFIKMP